MPRAKSSFLDKDGTLFVDCAECKRGGNGNKSCSAGHIHIKTNRGGCFNGQLFDHLKPISTKKKGWL